MSFFLHEESLLNGVTLARRVTLARKVILEPWVSFSRSVILARTKAFQSAFEGKRISKTFYVIISKINPIILNL